MSVSGEEPVCGLIVTGREQLENATPCFANEKSHVWLLFCFEHAIFCSTLQRAKKILFCEPVLENWAVGLCLCFWSFQKSTKKKKTKNSKPTNTQTDMASASSTLTDQSARSRGPATCDGAAGELDGPVGDGVGLALSVCDPVGERLG